MAVTANEPATYLDLYLEPLQRFLADLDVTDIYINRPGEVWIETLGGRIDRHAAETLTESFLWRLARQIAHFSHQGISRRHPLLAATLPDGSRVQIVAPPATRGPMAFAFRRHAARTPDLSTYASREPPQRTRASAAEPSVSLVERDYPAVLRDAVRRRLNIVISGGTSSGKTTLLNSLLAQIHTGERLVVIEDTPELRLAQQNSVGLIAVRGVEGESHVTPLDLLEAALRMRPDRILLGELRGPEAFTFLRAINTGHPGSMTTVHADSPDRAVTQLAMMALQANTGLSFESLRSLIVEMIDLIVQVERNEEQRSISNVMYTNPDNL